jgi:hypothetical protein
VEASSPALRAKLPELLLPAGSFESALAAIEGGADALYFGFAAFSARKQAKNFGELEYRRLLKFARGRGIPLIAYEEPAYAAVVPALTEMGVNCLMSANHIGIGEFRARFPTLGLTGGIRPRDLAEGPEAVDECLGRVREWLSGGRYIPEIESIPFMPWEDFGRFASGLREALS